MCNLWASDGENAGRKRPLITAGGEAADADDEKRDHWPAAESRWALLYADEIHGQWNGQLRVRGPVNHNLIYVKQENKLCIQRSISHPLSAGKGITTDPQSLSALTCSVYN